jgi:hypothetical protein
MIFRIVKKSACICWGKEVSGVLTTKVKWENFGNKTTTLYQFTRYTLFHCTSANLEKSGKSGFFWLAGAVFPA